MKYAITFVHTVEQTYIAHIEADNELDAKELFNKDPFSCVVGEPEDENGLEITIKSIEKEDL